LIGQPPAGVEAVKANGIGYHPLETGEAQRQLKRQSGAAWNEGGFGQRWLGIQTEEMTDPL
jgi:hypothetical protein